MTLLIMKFAKGTDFILYSRYFSPFWNISYVTYESYDMTILDQMFPIFVELCIRIMYGDLRKIYQEQVLNAPDSDDREGMMSVKNVVCGNIELECAYAAWEHWETVQDGRNIFEKLGK